MITGANTRDSLIATIEAFGSNKEGENVFRVEPFKRPLFENISKNCTLIVMGYSGSDDFDIIPTIKILKNLREVIWINHVQEDDGVEKINEINELFFRDDYKIDKVNQILFDIYRMQNANKIYKADVNTTRLVGELLDHEPNISLNNFAIDPIVWLKDNIILPDESPKYYIPYIIFKTFGYLDDGMRCVKKVLEIAKKSNNVRLMASCLNNIGSILDSKDELDEALKYYNEALAIDEESGSLDGISETKANIASILDYKEELDEAMKYYKEALSISKKIGNLKTKSRILNDLSVIFYKKDELDESLECLQESLAIDDQIGNIWGKLSILTNIGTLLIHKRSYLKAVDYCKEALALSRQLGEIEYRAINLNNLGTLSGNGGRIEQALKYYEDALVLFKKLNSPDVKFVSETIELLKDIIKDN